MPLEVITNLKRQYLVKRIKESNLSLLDYPHCSQMGYILKLAKDEFFFSAPEVVDDCFHTFKHVIELDEDLYQGLGKIALDESSDEYEPPSNKSYNSLNLLEYEPQSSDDEGSSTSSSKKDDLTDFFTNNTSISTSSRSDDDPFTNNTSISTSLRSDDDPFAHLVE